MTDQVGVIGLGVLGSAIAEVLLGNQFNILGCDPNETRAAPLIETGMAMAKSPKEVIENCDIVITCLPSSDALNTIVSGERGLLSGEKAGAIIIDVSTLPIVDKINARDVLAAAQISLMDCPVSGNRIMALNGELTAFASGDPTDFEKVKYLLEGFCRIAHYVGPFGDGMKMKICGNILNLVHNSVAAEVMVLGMKSGLDPKKIHQVISGSGSSSRMFDVRGGLMAENDFAKEGMNFSVPLKDARIITDHAAHMLCPTPVYQAALQPYFAAVAQGYADLDASAVIKALETAANVERDLEKP